MQVICMLAVDAERYLKEKQHSRLRPPPCCPHCGQSKALWALGYYPRYLSALIPPGVLQIWVRRFRCRSCGKTISLLPGFAQPYRLVRNETIHQFVLRDFWRKDVLYWSHLLVRYWKRFEQWVSEIRIVTRGSIERAPPDHQAEAWWLRIIELWGGPQQATAVLVGKYQITLFGRYRCHRPNPPSDP